MKLNFGFSLFFFNYYLFLFKEKHFFWELSDIDSVVTDFDHNSEHYSTIVDTIMRTELYQQVHQLQILIDISLMFNIVLRK